MNRKANYIILILVLFGCNRHSEQSFDDETIMEFKRLNDLIIRSEEQFWIISSDSVIKDKKVDSIFRSLNSQNKVEYIEVVDKDNIFYKVKHEKLKPVGPGLFYFSHYLVYSTSQDAENKILLIELEEAEEKLVKIKKIENGWYYLIGEHFSD